MRRTIITTFASLLLTAAPAAAIPPPYGGLTQRPGAAGCITNSAWPPCATVNGFYYPGDAQLTPDGKQLILTDPGNDALVIYNRAPDGSLTYSGCVSKDGTGQHGTCATDGFLISPQRLAVAPGGRQVYVVTGNSSSLLLTLDRNPATGALTPAGCLAKASSLLCAGTPGISGAQSIAISADGSLLAVGADPGIVVFKRNPTDGTLTDVGCVDDGSSGSCVNGGTGYNDIEGVAIAPDDRAVYGAARAGNSVLVIGYDPQSNQALTALQCLSSPHSPPAGCTAVDAVFAPNDITVSPAGTGARSVYTADFNAREVSTFTRNADDTLTWLSCRSYDGNAGSAMGVCQTDYRLQLASRVMVSPDGRNVYAIAPRGNPKQGSQDIAIYSRDANSGLITPLPDPNSCWADSDTGPEGGCQQANGLADPVAMALSPVGDQMYVAVDNDQGASGGPHPPGGIAIFNRELPPTCSPASAATPAGKPVTLTLRCVGSNGIPVTVHASKPRSGRLSAVGSTGKVTFTPPKHFVGNVQFTFAASDGTLSSAPATGTIHVLAPGLVKVSIPAQTVTVTHGVAKVRLRCSGPRGRTCSGSLTLSARIGGHLRTIGSAHFSIKTGNRAAVRVVITTSLGRTYSALAVARYLARFGRMSKAKGRITLVVAR